MDRARGTDGRFVPSQAGDDDAMNGAMQTRIGRVLRRCIRPERRIAKTRNKEGRGAAESAVRAPREARAPQGSVQAPREAREPQHVAWFYSDMCSGAGAAGGAGTALLNTLN